MLGYPVEVIKWLLEQDSGKLFEAKEYKQRRSLNANAYMWQLITQIADAVRAGKDEIYLQMLKRYGQRQMISVVSEADMTAYFKYFEEKGRSILNGKEFTHYLIYKGSSEYDTREMAVLIDGVVDEAKELGIETLTPEEIERLKAGWRQ